ncbi:MAG: translocation/assembly module TamB domain-containing protein [Muribaculaceae bacterium]|nr:translocation/assembly module TamB domain-containing protein [Muribaculaceae bacterium]
MNDDIKNQSPSSPEGSNPVNTDTGEVKVASNQDKSDEKEAAGQPDDKSDGRKKRKVSRWLTIPAKILMCLIILIILIPIALYIPPIQTWVKDIACSYIKKSTGMDVEIDRFRLKFPLDVSLQGVKVIEATGDTMVVAREVIADVAMLPLMHLDIDVERLSLLEGYYRMVSPDSSMIMKIRAGKLTVDPGSVVQIKQSNILLRKASLENGDVQLYMNVWKQQSTPPDSTSTPFYIQLGDLDVKNIRFAMSMLPTIDTLVLNAKTLELRNGIIDLRKNIINASLMKIDGGDATYIAPTPEYVAAHPVPVDSTAVPSAPMTITADSIAIDNFGALYAIKGAKPLPGFDANYIKVSDVAIGMRGFFNQQANLRLPITRLNAIERSGLQITRGAGVIALNEAGIKIEGVDIATPYSAISATADLPFALMELQPSAPVNANLSASLGMKDILAFMPDMKAYVTPFLGNVVNAKVDAQGTLADVAIRQLDVALPGILSLRASGTAKNALDIKKLIARVRFDGELRNPAPIEKLAGPMPFKVPALTLSGVAGANGQNYDADFRLLTAKGDVVGNGKVGLNSEVYNADISIGNLDVAHFVPDLGVGSVTARIKANGAGFNPTKSGAHTDLALDVAHIDYNKKALRDIRLKANLAGHDFSVYLDSPNADANMHAEVSGTLKPDYYCAQGLLRIYNADLQAFGLSNDVNYGAADLSFDVTAQPGKWLYDATVDCSSVAWHLPTQDIILPEGIHIDFIADPDDVIANLMAKGTDVEFHSPTSLKNVVEGVTKAMTIAEKQIKAQNLDFEEMQAILPTFTLDGRVSGQGLISTFLQPSGMAIDTVAFNLRNDSLISGNIMAQRLNTGSMILDTLNLDLLERGQLIDYKFHMGNKPGGTLDEFAQVNLNGYFGSNRLSAYLTQRNSVGVQGYRFGFTAAVADSVMSLHFTPLKATIAYLPWQFNEDNHIDYNLLDRRLNANLQASSRESSILLKTETADNGQDNLHLNIKNIHVEDFLRMSMLAPPIQASVDGDVVINYDGKTLNGNGDIAVHNLIYDKMMVGDFDLGLKAGLNFQGETQAEAFLKVDGQPALSLSTILEQNGDAGLEPKTVDLNLTDFPLKVANAFLGPDIAKLSGALNGKLNMSGSMSAPMLNGDIECDDVNVFIPMIGSNLKFDSQPITVADNLVNFNNFRIFGANDNPLTLAGNVDARSLSDIKFDLSANASNFALVNNTAKANSDLYGKLFLNLNAGVVGPMSHFDVNADLTVLGTSDFTYQVPLTTATQLTNTTTQDVVKFVNFADTTHLATKDTVQSSMAMRVRATATISPGTVVNVVIPSSASGGGKAQLNPSGTLTYFQNFMGDMTLNGELMLGNGYVKYKVPVLGEKDFVFNPQSSVAFNGNIMNPILNIHATENVRASVANSSGNSSMVNFQIGLSVTNNLENPKVVFDLSTDDDMSLKNELESMTPDQRSTQAMNLLITGRYQGAGMKTLQGNVGENMLYSLVESSLNSLASKYVKGVDLSFGIDQYDTLKDGQQGSTTSYSYQLSKSLFSNKFKIVVGGNYSSDASADENLAQNLISDISFEYTLKQTNSLTMLVRLFRHVGFENVLEGEVTETGVGFTMRRRISDLRKLFKVRWGRRKPTSPALPADSQIPSDSANFGGSAAGDDFREVRNDKNSNDKR